MSLLFCNTHHLLHHSIFIPSIGPRRAGFSNDLSPFATDDLYDLSDEDESDSDDDTFSGKEAEIHEVIPSAAVIEEKPENSFPPEIMVTLGNYDQGRTVTRPDYREDKSEDEKDSDSDDDEEQNEYQLPRKIKPLPKRRRWIAARRQKEVRPLPYRFNNTLPITFVLALPPYRNQFSNDPRPDGQMTEYEFSLVLYGFINQMSGQKRFKSVINHELAVYIRRCMNEGTPESGCAGSFKYWAKKMFSLEDDPAGDKSDGMGGKYLVHDDRRVAIVEDFYELLTQAHQGTQHGGRDKVMRLIRNEYSYLPKELVGRFTGTCPRCHPIKAAEFFQQQIKLADADDRTARDFPPASSSAQKRRLQTLPIDSDHSSEDEARSYRYNKQSSLETANIQPIKVRPAKLRFRATPVPVTRRSSDSSDSLLSIAPTPIASCDSGIESEAISPISQYLDVSSTDSSATATPLFSPPTGSGWNLSNASSGATHGFFEHAYEPSANHVSIESMIDPTLTTTQSIPSNQDQVSCGTAQEQPAPMGEPASEGLTTQHEAFGHHLASGRPPHNALDILLKDAHGKGARRWS